MSIKQLFDLSGKTALITGGSRGLGLQIAEALGEMGASLSLVARKNDELEQAHEHLKHMGITSHIIQADLKSESVVPELVEKALSQLKNIDILVNNAGASWGAPAEDYPPEAWHKLMNLNINAMFFMSQEVGRKSMIPRKYGKIINVASVAGLRGNASANMNTIAYNSSKGAAVNFTRALAAEWGKYNINVNSICPGFFPSKMTHGLLDQISENVLKRTPLGRIGGEEDLKGAAVYLASEASRHVTGQYIAVDGGSCIC
jgi:NAD(P)-dependent dehydrogenase (short-subunit alcohol dehydrogenase family)